MDYTLSDSYVTDAGTAQRMHLQAQAVPTAVSDADLNGLIWETLAAIKAGGLVPADFDKTVPASYTQLRDAIAIAVRLKSAAYASAGGTTDALTGVYDPVVPALVNGLTLYVRAASANVTTIPTFSPNGLAAKTIVKGNGLALVVGDIAGAGHWIELQYDLTLDKWVLLNPAFGALAPATRHVIAVESRVANTMYTNTTRKVMTVVAAFTHASLAFHAYSSGSVPMVGDYVAAAGSGYGSHITFMVLPGEAYGWTYNTSLAVPGLTGWTETY